MSVAVPRNRSSSDSALAQPGPSPLVPIDNGVLPAFEDDVEVPTLDGLCGPPAVDDAPFLTHDCDRPTIDHPRRPVELLLDRDRPWGVQSSRATSSARCSGILDHGATSTTVQTPPSPVLAFTWRRPSRSIPCSSSHYGRTCASCCPVDSVSSRADRKST